MIVTFCGHSDFYENCLIKSKMMTVLETYVKDVNTDFYLGGYGFFDSFAYSCTKEYQKTHPNTSLIFVTPYISLEYQQTHLKQRLETYDSILYPGFEDKHPKFAISYRNKYMIESADLVVSYIEHTWGGAYQSYLYALRKRKHVINLADDGL